MGIRFRCHHCQYELHVKDFQAGKRSRCPQCDGRFRIPQSDTNYSIPVDNSQDAPSSNGNIAVVEQPSRAAKQLSSVKVADDQPIAVNNKKAASTLPQEPKASPPKFGQVPKAISEAPAAIWYVRPPSGGEYGPAPSEVFFDWMKEHRVTRDSLVWREGWPQWLSATEAFNDYFGPDSAPSLAKDLNHKPVGLSSVRSKSESPASAISDLASRKKRRKQRYLWLIAFLSILVMFLIVVLSVVVSRPPT